jgi:putative flippase GtrA
MIDSLLRGNSTFAQMFRYGLVAGVGLVVDFGTVIYTGEVLGFHYLLAACSGFILGLIVTYIFSNLLVFGKPQGDRRKHFMLFAVIGIVGLGILNLLMWIMTGWFGINYIVSKALATIVVFAWNFFARKSLYKDEPEAQDIPYEL